MSDDEAQGQYDWLTRLTPAEWLSAASTELAHATEALTHKQQRAGVAQARRAAGMAWNAVLLGIAVLEERQRFGRSYMDHLKALCDEPSVSAAVREAAVALISAPLSPVLVQLGTGDARLATAAGVIIEEARRRIVESRAG